MHALTVLKTACQEALDEGVILPLHNRTPVSA
jgi:hypothetical protein